MVVPKTGDTVSQKSGAAIDAEEQDLVNVPAPRTPASVLYHSAQENMQLEPSDGTDLRQFDEILDVEDTLLGDLRTLGDA